MKTTKIITLLLSILLILSCSVAEAVETKGRISGDEAECTLRNEESKGRLMESTDQKNSWNWGSLYASFLSTEAIDQEKPDK